MCSLYVFMVSSFLVKLQLDLHFFLVSTCHDIPGTVDSIVTIKMQKHAKQNKTKQNVKHPASIKNESLKPVDDSMPNACCCFQNASR